MHALAGLRGARNDYLVVEDLTYYTLALLGWQVSFTYRLLFGALISLTDPIAMMSSSAPKPLQTTIVGESLFNDATAVVMFSILLGVLMIGHPPRRSAK
ncbi:hypothetical protein GCM10027514_23350 [Azotobacter armeniacus]